jgi:hypothetical protein
MRKLGWIGALLGVLLGTGIAGCVVRERPVARRAYATSPCAGGHWVEGHYGYGGEYYRGHWRCPTPSARDSRVVGRIEFRH